MPIPSKMNTATERRIRKAKDTGVRDRLGLAGDMQDGVSITRAAAPRGVRRAAMASRRGGRM